MEYDVILTDAGTIQDAFEVGYSLIRINNISQKELEVLSRIVSRDEKIMLIALPLTIDGEPKES